MPIEAGRLATRNMSEYSVYVAQSRAIPDVIDGLKPVQRRIITSADDLHLYHTKRFMKAAKLEGQVMGDYHPHGGAGLSGLVQPFTIRYPLLEGQGNWGSPDDPGSVAASRYVEVRLSEFCEDFYLSTRTDADKAPNYDGRLEEVIRYFPPIPGVLITSASGIAVGLTTNIPPHEIGAVCTSILKYLDHDDTYLNLYPETCEGSVFLSSLDEVREYNSTGYGTFRYKAKVHYEREGRIHCLVVDAFPPNYSKKRLENYAIIEAVEAGNLSLTNESSKTIRYVFRSTDLSILEMVESLLVSSVTYRCIAENRGVLHQYTLNEIYDEFIVERSQYIVKKYTSLREKSDRELDYLICLYRLKKSPDVIRSMIDLSEEDCISLLRNEFNPRYEDTINRILRTQIRSLLRDNTEEINDRIEQEGSKIEEYDRYIGDPVSKIRQDILDLMSKYATDSNCVVDSGDDEFIAYCIEDGSVVSKKVSSEDDRSARGDYNYYILCDDVGFVAVDRESLLSRMPDTVFKGVPTRIYGVNDLSEIKCDIDGRVWDLGKWALRKRKSMIRGRIIR